MSSEQPRWVPGRRLDAYEVLRTGRLGGLGCGSERAAVEDVLGPPQAVGRRMKGYVLLKYGHVTLTLESKGGGLIAFYVEFGVPEESVVEFPGGAPSCEELLGWLSRSGIPHRLESEWGLSHPSVFLENGLKVQSDAPTGVWSMSMTCPA